MGKSSKCLNIFVQYCNLDNWNITCFCTFSRQIFQQYAILYKYVDFFSKMLDLQGQYLYGKGLIQL